MRKIVNLTKPKDGIVRLMIFNGDYGTYLFGYKKSDWTEIPNPEPNCQHDWINPIRIKGRENGKPEFGKLEKLINGKWTEFELTE